MARIEYRRAILAAQAVRVLCELIAAGAANGTAVIHRSGPGIAEEAGEAGRKTLVQFNSQTVVVSGTRAHEILNPARKLRIRCAAGSSGRSRNRPVSVHQILQLAALHAVVTDFER